MLLHDLHSLGLDRLAYHIELLELVEHIRLIGIKRHLVKITTAT